MRHRPQENGRCEFRWCAAGGRPPAVSHPQAPSDPAPRTVELTAGLAAYTDEGEGPAVLAVHGLPGSARDFRWLAPALTEHFRVLRVDLPGFGQTPWTTRPGYSAADRAAFLAELLTTLALPPVLAVGHSMGGPVITALAVAAPERVRKLAFIASPGLDPHKGFRRMPRRALSGWFAGDRRGRFTMPVARRAFAMLGFRGPYPDEALLHTLHGVAAFDFRVHARNLEALRKPCAVFSCLDDPLIEPQISAALARAVPDGPRMTFDSGGHNPQKFQAHEIAEALSSWG